MVSIIKNTRNNIVTPYIFVRKLDKTQVFVNFCKIWIRNVNINIFWYRWYRKHVWYLSTLFRFKRDTNCHLVLNESMNGKWIRFFCIVFLLKKKTKQWAKFSCWFHCEKSHLAPIFHLCNYSHLSLSQC